MSTAIPAEYRNAVQHALEFAAVTLREVEHWQQVWRERGSRMSYQQMRTFLGECADFHGTVMGHVSHCMFLVNDLELHRVSDANPFVMRLRQRAGEYRYFATKLEQLMSKVGGALYMKYSG